MKQSGEGVQNGGLLRFTLLDVTFIISRLAGEQLGHSYVATRDNCEGFLRPLVQLEPPAAIQQVTRVTMSEFTIAEQADCLDQRFIPN